MKKVAIILISGLFVGLLSLCLKGILAAERYIRPVRNSVEFSSIRFGYHQSKPKELSNCRYKGWGFDISYHIKHNGCLVSPLIVSEDVFGRVRGLYGTYETDACDTIPEWIVNAFEEGGKL